MFTTISKLTGIKWLGECADIYTNEITILAGLARFSGDEWERIVKMQLVISFHVSMGLSKLPDNRAGVKLLGD